jgi:hypothetical protein
MPPWATEMDIAPAIPGPPTNRSGKPRGPVPWAVHIWDSDSNARGPACLSRSTETASWAARYRHPRQAAPVDDAKDERAADTPPSSPARRIVEALNAAGSPAPTWTARPCG